MRLKHKHDREGLSLIEVLVVMAVIAILASIVLPQVTGVIRTSQMSTARQQQAELQTALGNWIVATSAGPGGLAGARNTYSNSSNRLALISNYIQETSYESFSSTNENTLTSEALRAVNASLRFSPWTTPQQQPAVEWINK